jgi:hypothetical protein
MDSAWTNLVYVGALYVCYNIVDPAERRDSMLAISIYFMVVFGMRVYMSLFDETYKWYIFQD